MKILTIATTPFFADRGCHLRIYNEVRGLVKLGHQVQICTYHHGQNIPGLDIHRISPVSWYQKTSPGFAWGKIWLDWKLLLLLKKQIRTFSPEILHCHNYEGLAIGWLANLFSVKKIPLIADLQGDLENELENYNSKNWLIKMLSLPLVGFFLSQAKAVLISSSRGQETLQRKYPRIKNIHLIPDGIDLELFSAKNIPSDQTFLQEVEKIKTWKASSRLLIYAGGLSSAKGLWDWFLFFGQNFSAKDSWKFLIFGSGEEKKLFQEKIEKNQWQNKIFLAENHGYFQLPFYLNLADVAIEPKNNSTESSGKLPVYMATGLPILCFENVFNRAILKKQGCYFSSWKEAEKNLKSFSLSKPVSYSLENLDNQKEVQKIEKIFLSLKK